MNMASSTQETAAGTLRVRCSSPQARARISVASRTVAAIVGGYALSAAACAALGLALPMARATAVFSATMLSFALFCAVVMWAFYAPSARRVWGGIVAATGLLVLIVVLLQPAGST